MPSKQQWFKIIGHSKSDIIPAHRLPTNRVVMMRYNFLMTQNKLKSMDVQRSFIPRSKTYGIVLVYRLLIETCVTRINHLLCSWNDRHCRQMKDGDTNYNSYQDMLNSVLNMTYSEPEQVWNFYITNCQLKQIVSILAKKYTTVKTI